MPHAAGLSRRRGSAVAFLLAALLVPLLVPSPARAAVTLGPDEAAFCTLINNYRATKGLPALMVSPTATNASGWMSSDMAAKNYFSHTDSLGRDPFQRMGAFGYNFSTYKGENIAAGNAGAQATFDQWKNSSGHNANMLNANYKVIGIGRAYNASATYRYYWTTDFGGAVDSGSVPCSGNSTPPPPPSVPAVSIADVSVVEGNSNIGATKAVKFKVSIPTAATGSVKVNFATAGGSASAGADYLSGSGTATIKKGSTSVMVTVRVVKDRVREPDETFTVNLSAPVGATIGDGTGVGTIVNDD